MEPHSSHAASLPGGVGITHLRVYDTVGPDGLAGGTPHLHTVCTEAYLVIAGEGEVQTLDSGGFGRTPLRAGTVAWFSPGTVHRLVNHGELEIFVVMSHAGLPEAGDLVIAFDSDTLANRDAYAEAAALAPPTERRDRAVEAFAGWRAAVDADPAHGLSRLHTLAGSIVAERADGWDDIVEASTGTELTRSLSWIEALTWGTTDHLAEAAIASQEPVTDDRRLGCCGTLGVVARVI